MVVSFKHGSSWDITEFKGRSAPEEESLVKDSGTVGQFQLKKKKSVFCWAWGKGLIIGICFVVILDLRRVSWFFSRCCMVKGKQLVTILD